MGEFLVAKQQEWREGDERRQREAAENRAKIEKYGFAETLKHKMGVTELPDALPKEK